MRRKSMKQFIQDNKDELDTCIRKAVGQENFKINNAERRLWILNDEGLYSWARSEGVKV